MPMFDNYLSGLQDWRDKAESNLRGEKSWLALLELFWFDHGANSFGSHPSNAIVFPKGKSPEHIGTFELKAGVVHLHPQPGISITVDGKDANDTVLKPDVSGEPSEMQVDGLVMMVVQRGERFGLRVWDHNNPRRKNFPGRIWYDPSESYLAQARFSTYEPTREIPITNILGDTSDTPLAGYVQFDLDGHANRLDALESAGGRLFIIFKDQTSQQETYPAGRYLYTDAPSDGKVLLDFNRAYNPPCAFTDFATCPLPPYQNHLPYGLKPANGLRSLLDNTRSHYLNKRPALSGACSLIGLPSAIPLERVRRQLRQLLA